MALGLETKPLTIDPRTYINELCTGFIESSPIRPIEELSEKLREVLEIVRCESDKYDFWYKSLEANREVISELLESFEEIREKILKTEEMMEWIELIEKPDPYYTRSLCISSDNIFMSCGLLASLTMKDIIKIIPKLNIDASSDHSVIMGKINYCIQFIRYTISNN
jgi:hypothetical protein